MQGGKEASREGRRQQARGVGGKLGKRQLYGKKKY